MSTLDEINALNEASKILRRARYDAVSDAMPIYKKICHAIEWVDTQLAALFAA